MFLTKQSKSSVNKYVNLLQRAGALSNLFSDSPVPALYYRASENIFCEAFGADNHSRSDTSVDAGKDGLGIGIKTYNNGNGKTYQKIAEFNKNRKDYVEFINNPSELIKIICELRNKRLETTFSMFGLKSFIYHCITREKGRFLIFEEEMMFINIAKIQIINDEKNVINFTDGIHNYKFNISKSTLYKQFITRNPFTFDVRIIENPYLILDSFDLSILPTQPISDVAIYLPLYSKKNNTLYVPARSGLNQWNAKGRIRDEREVYIRIPLWIHRKFPDFFPSKEVSFKLKLPNGKIISAKVCQEGGKALMSNPNKALGTWLIDTVLKIKPGEIVTYELLQSLNIDTVEVRKISNKYYEIDFKSLGTFEEFENENFN